MMKKYISFIVFFLFFSLGDMYGQSRLENGSKNEQAKVDIFVLNNSIRMYPNPVGSILTIESKIPITKVQIYSLLGQLVKEKDNNFKRIQLSDLNHGIYMIKIHADNVSITKKLVKR
jgi:hypothetical protein